MDAGLAAATVQVMTTGSSVWDHALAAELSALCGSSNWSWPLQLSLSNNGSGVCPCPDVDGLCGGNGSGAVFPTMAATGDGGTSAVDNSSLSTMTSGTWTMKYPLYATVIIAVLAGICSIVTVVGNIMVLAAFALERAIRQPSNYLIASLAVTDVLIGLFSMPLYTLYLLSDQYWPLGEWPCDLWLSLDYTVCLVSQYTVFLITLDRFCSVKIPTRYRSWRTAFKMKVMIAATWVVPSLVFFVSILGWQHFVGVRTVGENECYVQFTEDPLFNTVLVISYYWVTLIIMIGLYAGIYRIALGLHAKSAEKRKRVGRITSATSSATTSRREESESGAGAGCGGGCGGGAAAAAGDGDASSCASPRPAAAATGRRDSMVVFELRRGVGRNKDREKASERNGTVTVLLSPSPTPSNSPLPSPPPARDSMARWALAVAPLMHGDSLLSCDSSADIAGASAAGAAAAAACPVSPGRPTALQLAFSPSALVGGSSRVGGCANGGATIGSPTVARYVGSGPPRTQLLRCGVVALDLESPLWKPRGSLPNCNVDWTCFSGAAASSPAPAAVPSADAIAAPVSLSTKANGHATCRRVTSEPSRPAPLAAAESTPSGEGNSSGGSGSGSAAAGGSGGGSGGGSAAAGGSGSGSAAAGGSASASGGSQQPLSKAINKLCTNLVQLTRGSTRESKGKRPSSQNRAMKALKTITLILGAFVFFWTPYHIAVLVVGFCPQKQECVDKTFYAFSYWLCYCNSPINPFCYALSNDQFKKSFLKMLRFQYCLRKRK